MTCLIDDLISLADQDALQRYPTDLVENVFSDHGMPASVVFELFVRAEGTTAAAAERAEIHDLADGAIERGWAEGEFTGINSITGERCTFPRELRAEAHIWVGEGVIDGCGLRLHRVRWEPARIDKQNKPEREPRARMREAYERLSPEIGGKTTKEQHDAVLKDLGIKGTPRGYSYETFRQSIVIRAKREES